MSEERCEHCHWFKDGHGVEELDDRGYCKRFPPTVAGFREIDDSDSIHYGGTIIVMSLPRVYQNDYCGEFSERKA